MDYFKVDDKVVMRYTQPVPKLVRIGADVQVYFDCQYGISLAFVDEETVPALLGFRGGCCGGKKQIFFPATETHYKHWFDGHGGR